MLIQKRIEGFDLLRTTALILVLLQHSFMFTDAYFPKLRIFWILSHSALDFFFVLSGFLIAGILDKLQTQVKGGLNLKNTFHFYIRRWFKTLPMFFLVIIICLILSYLNIYYPKDFSFSFIFSTQNISETNFDFLPHTYSLAIEEWFYLLLPICIIVFTKLFKNKNAIYTILLFWIFFTLVARIILHLNLENWDAEIRKSIISRIDALFLLLSIVSFYFIGFIFYIFYEKPIMDLRNRIKF
ncbi:Putative acyltransferase (fragment) [Flavobacterium sp. 9AF]|uniref:acyltransferase family protein n=1 Tax=Flavobacterium sp. 9AF TaxID=2653142 RepID=UPI0012EF6CE0